MSATAQRDLDHGPGGRGLTAFRRLRSVQAVSEPKRLKLPDPARLFKTGTGNTRAELPGPSRITLPSRQGSRGVIRPSCPPGEVATECPRPLLLDTLADVILAFRKAPIDQLMGLNHLRDSVL